MRPRLDKYLFNFDAVNEAVVNALVHNDWSITEPLFSFFLDRIEIISHGGLPYNQTKEQFYQGISKPRNEKLMRIFLNMGIVEHTGHGIPTIISEYGKEAFEINDTYLKVTIQFNKSVLEKQSVGLNVGLNLSNTENHVISLILLNSNHTALSISKELGLCKRTIERVLSSLQNKEVIERIGSKKMGRWNVLK